MRIDLVGPFPAGPQVVEYISRFLLISCQRLIAKPVTAVRAYTNCETVSTVVLFNNIQEKILLHLKERCSIRILVRLNVHAEKQLHHRLFI